MSDTTINTQGGDVFQGDFHGTQIKGDQIIVINGYSGADLEKVLAELRRLFATGKATLQAHLRQGRLLVSVPDERPVILSEEAARDLAALAARQGDELAYIDALCIHPDYLRWGSYYVQQSGLLAEVRRLPAWAETNPEYHLLLARGEGGQRAYERIELKDVTEAVDQYSELVILGKPGYGKTTTLERLVLRAAQKRQQDDQAKLPLLLPLADFRGFDAVYDFVQDAWRKHLGALDLTSYLRKGRLLLLFDALNELPFQDDADYRKKLAGLRDFVTREWPGNQAIFTCRTLDYSEPLGFPQVEIQALTDPKVHEFLMKRLEPVSPELAGRAWDRLRGDPLLELMRTPYYLNMLCLLLETGGEWPESLAGLFSRFVATLLKREANKGRPGWPGEQVLQVALAELAFKMQPQGEGTRLPEADVIAALPNSLVVDGKTVLLDGQTCLRCSADANLLDIENLFPKDQPVDETRTEGRIVRFFHHQLQEYFAARALLDRFRRGADLSRLWRQPAKAAEMPDPGKLEPHEPMPLPPPTGWEEPTALAAGLAVDPAWRVAPEQFLKAILTVNPVLAARCLGEAGMPDLPQLTIRAKEQLLTLMRGRDIHRRARLAAGLALGKLGDPRFVEVEIDGARVLLPPLVYQARSKARLGTTRWEAWQLKICWSGLEFSDEQPAHHFESEPLWMGKYPVTNAEYRCFWEDGGYDNVSYWHTLAAKAWLRGDDPVGGAESELMDFSSSTPEKPLEKLRRVADELWNKLLGEDAPESSIKQIRSLLIMDQEQAICETEKEFGRRDRTCPAFWDDEKFNNPSQPVVGINWYEAGAFCAWLQGKLAMADSASALLQEWLVEQPELAYVLWNTKLHLGLPTEAEWETASRGKYGREYPWGRRFSLEHANTQEGQMVRTTPVGMYPLGTTVDGLEDMAGNVFEWTASLYQPYPIRVEDGRNDQESVSRRTVRGGNYYDGIWSNRCASRFSLTPAIYSLNTGFRLVLSLANAEF